MVLVMKKRCSWAGTDPLYIHYHDHEWGVPVHDDQKLFEFLILESFQAGLSWITILRKREAFREAFDAFDPVKIAVYGMDAVRRLTADSAIVRNRLKIEAAVQNARAFLALQSKYETFDQFVWRFVDGRPRENAWRHISEIPSETGESRIMSKELKQNGFKFVGPVICYAFMQATGMVNDHTVDCFRYNEIRGMNA